jgi:serine/threonine protein kinase
VKPTSLTQIAKYRVEGELGRGGMGVVYKAFDPVVERAVAIKTIRLDAENAEDLVIRLKREAKSVGHLEHPNIVTLYEAGEWEGLFYLSMQFVRGETLEKRIERQHWFTLQETYDVFRQACAGLDHAHQHGIIHRDIKPANIMIGSDGVVKLADFGIAKVADAHTSTSGLIVGTPSYMSPEQALGRPLDGRSDIFSLGSILYEMVTGERAFPGQHATTVIYKIVHEAPTPVAKLQPGIDPALEAMVLKAIAKRPEDRFQSCGELAAAIEVYLKRAASAATRVQAAMPPPAPVPAAPVPPRQISPEPSRQSSGSGGYFAPAAPAPPEPAPPAQPEVHYTPAPLPSGTANMPATPLGIPPAPSQRSPYLWILLGAAGALLGAGLSFVFIARGPRHPGASPPTAVRQPMTTSLATSNAPAPVPENPGEPAAVKPHTGGGGSSHAQETHATKAVRATVKQAPEEVTPPSMPAIHPAPTNQPQKPSVNPAPATPQPVPETFDNLIVQGDVNFQQSKYQEALQDYLRAYRLNPRSADARQKIAVTYTMLGKPEEAAKYQ